MVGLEHNMSDLRNAVAKARDEWIESDEGRCCMSPVSGLEPQFLQNRLECAFLAGYQAAENNIVDYSVWFARERAKYLCQQASLIPERRDDPRTLQSLH